MPYAKAPPVVIRFLPGLLLVVEFVATVQIVKTESGLKHLGRTQILKIGCEVEYTFMVSVGMRSVTDIRKWSSS